MTKIIHHFEQNVRSFIESQELFKPTDKLLVALSGGADSVAMLLCLNRLGYPLMAAHCNFHLRGEESERDMDFCIKLCHRLKIQLHINEFETEAYAHATHISIEMAARELRYTWFREMARIFELDRIAVAHHKDDNVETFLLNLIRGSGIAGLTGIKPVSYAYLIPVVRPLLDVSRHEILEYLKAIGQDYVTDSSNLTDDYTRNKIRLNLLPLMAEINPSVNDTINATTHRLKGVERVYRQGIRIGTGKVFSRTSPNVIRIPILQNEPDPRSLLYEILSEYGFSSAQSEEIFRSLDGESGKTFSNSRWEVLKNRTHLIIRQREDNNKEWSEHVNDLPYTRYFDDTHMLLSINAFSKTCNYVIPKEKNYACLDADKVRLPLVIRPWRHGDVLYPFGMNGKKLVSDLLTDLKFSRYDKEKQLVICDAADRLVWVVGVRSDNRFRITETTKNIIEIKSVKE